FQKWFPQYGDFLAGAIRQECLDEYLAYKTNNVSSCPAPLNTDKNGCTASTVINCLLNTVPEYWKANMAAASVLLGVMPTILSIMGSSSMETGLLAMRRPLLSLLLGVGAPSAFPLRAFEYSNPEEMLRKGTGSIGWGEQLGRPVAAVVVALQYLIVCAAVANVSHITYELCVFSVCSFLPEMQVLPAVWLALALAVYVLGDAAVMLRIRLREQNGRCRTLGEAVRQEFQLSALRPMTVLEFRPESRIYILISWLTATGNIMHIIFGTVIFSSLQFIGTQDAFVILNRYLASSFVCRIIIMFEISGMRRTV
ncbi:hypothetical protein GQ53DRAFT_597400, partial [Thozetella sp. PMI_491]